MFLPTTELAQQTDTVVPHLFYVKLLSIISLLACVIE